MYIGGDYFFYFYFCISGNKFVGFNFFYFFNIQVKVFYLVSKVKLKVIFYIDIIGLGNYFEFFFQVVFYVQDEMICFDSRFIFNYEFIFYFNFGKFSIG